MTEAEIVKIVFYWLGTFFFRVADWLIFFCNILFLSFLTGTPLASCTNALFRSFEITSKNFQKHGKKAGKNGKKVEKMTENLSEKWQKKSKIFQKKQEK